MTRHIRPLRPILLAGCAFCALALGTPHPAGAQDDTPPTITLGGSQPAGSDDTAAVTETPPAAAAVPGGPDTPVIQLQPRTVPDDVPLAPPVERDRATAPDVTGEDWLLPLIAPNTQLPREVRIGESLPAPGVLRLTGETASTRLTLELPENVIPPSEVQLALRSGVDVLTGTATLRASVNGAEPVEMPLRTIGDFATVSLPGPSLTTGPNTIDLTVDQPHRIYCGPDASFHVWTEIDLANSGANVPADALRPDAEGFALAMRAQLARSGSLDLLVGDTVDAAVLRQASEAMMASLAGRGRMRVTSFYGIEAPRFATVALIASDRSAISYRRGATGAIVLQVEYNGDQLPDLAAALPPPADSDAPLVQIAPGHPVPLSALGTGDIVGNTHYFRHDVAFALPDDWLLLANQKARLTLHYGFARSLAEGAILLVKVNEQTVRLLPLDRAGGQIQPPLPVGFNANLLNPGRNTLSFEMMVPGAPANEACPVRTSDMLVVLADSTLEVPTSPAMTLPGMAAPFSGLMPANVTVPDAVAANLDLQAQAIRLASALSSPLAPQEGVTLTLARLNELNLVPLDNAEVSLGQVQALLFTGATPDAAADETPVQAAPTYSLDEPGDGDADAPGIFSRIGTWASGGFAARDGLWQDVQSFRQTAFQGSQQSLREWMADRQGDALLWRPDPDQPDALWLILGPRIQVDDVADRVNALIASRSAIGEAAVLRPDGTWDVWTPIRPPVLAERLFGGNLRSILGNYASWSPLLFTLSLLALALLSALPALFYVLSTRDHRGRS